LAIAGNDNVHLFDVARQTAFIQVVFVLQIFGEFAFESRKVLLHGLLKHIEDLGDDGEKAAAYIAPGRCEAPYYPRKGKLYRHGLARKRKTSLSQSDANPRDQ
jgi:hypothetical protein